MYKFRVKTWGLTKNWGDARAKRALDGLGNGTLPQGGTQLRKLERYLARKPSALQQLQATHKAALQALLAEAAGGVPSVALTGPRPLQPRPATLRAPTQLALPDEIFRLLSTFLTSANDGSAMMACKVPEQDERSELRPHPFFPVSTPQAPPPSPQSPTGADHPSYPVLEFVLKFRLANSLITDAHHAAGFACLSVCFQQLSAMLVPQPLTLLYVLNAALEASTDFVLPDILALLFRYLRSLAEIRLGPCHPATEIAMRFGALEREQHTVVLALLRNLQVDSERPWQNKEVAFSVYDKTVEVWSAGEGEESYLGGLQGLLSEWEVVQPASIMTLWLRMRMGIALLERGEDGLVGEMLAREYPDVLIELRAPRRVSLSLQCYKIRARMWIEEGLLENAQGMFEMGRVLADATWGGGNEISFGFIEDAAKLALLRGMQGEI